MHEHFPPVHHSKFRIAVDTTVPIALISIILHYISLNVSVIYLKCSRVRHVQSHHIVFGPMQTARPYPQQWGVESHVGDRATSNRR